MNARHRVMFVDDEDGVRRSWDRYLTEEGYQVTTAEDGGKAMDRLRQEPVDVVVADLKMPNVDGVQLLEWMHDEHPETPFILLTGYGSEDVERRVRELGAFDYLDKPISPQALSAIITAALHLDLEPAEGTAAAGAEAPPVELVEEAAERAQTVESVAAAEAVGTWEVVEAVEVAEATAVAEEPGWSFLRGSGEVVGGLVLAPLLGLAFVMFLPIIAFGALFLAIGEAVLNRGGRPSA